MLNVLFLHSEKQREIDLAAAVIQGAISSGHVGLTRQTDTDWINSRDFKEADVVGFVGVKSLEIWSACRLYAKSVLYFDKGYSRRKNRKTGVWNYWRVSVNSHNPIQFVSAASQPTDRWDGLGIMVPDWRKEGKHIIFAGSSEKNHNFYGLPHPTIYATQICNELLKTGRKVVYRPKPSWQGARPIKGTVYSTDRGALTQLLIGAHVLVTNNSTCCYDALLAGVPSIILGQGIAKPLFSTTLDDICDPPLPDKLEIRQWLANLAYCQWTLDEYSSGQAWKTIEPQIGMC